MTKQQRVNSLLIRMDELLNEEASVRTKMRSTLKELTRLEYVPEKE